MPIWRANVMRPAKRLAVSAPRKMPETVGTNSHANSSGPRCRCTGSITGAAVMNRNRPAKLKATMPDFMWNSGERKMAP